MNRLIGATVIVLGLSATAAEPLRGDVTAEQVRQAIDRGVGYLLAQQRPDGSWSDTIDVAGRRSGYAYQVGGVTALCTLALLNAGIAADDPRMQKALNNLRTLQLDKTYAVSLQTMVFARAEPDKDHARVVRNVKWLERAQITTGDYSGAWTYGVPPRGTSADNSNSQFALLALHEAERVGIPASEPTWRRAQTYWEKCQKPDGSWDYMLGNGTSTGSMTCAGITSLAIADARALGNDAHVVGDQVYCCMRRMATNADRIEQAMQWLGQNFSVTRNPGSPGEVWCLYYLYGLERAGRLTARRFIPLPPRPGQVDRADWYREGADRLVRLQDRASGAWTEVPVNQRIATSFALLFLSKGRWPVLLGKLQYGNSNDDWNSHRHDAGNLTRYVESRWKHDLTWQVIDLRRASVEDLLQTPVLYLCGSRSPLPEHPEERTALAQKLRDYLDRGGFLLAEANCGSGVFDDGFRVLMQEVFPEPEYKLRLLEPEHPVWHAEETIAPHEMRPLWGIDAGCRTSVVYAPPDPPDAPRPSLSGLWELSQPGRGVKYSRAVQAQIDAALSLGLNVLAYATNRKLKTKDDFFRSDTEPSPRDQVERGRLEVANLRHPGACYVAPRALVNLMDAAAGELKLRTHVREELLDITDPALFDYPLVFMHGRTAFHLTDDERRQLKQYVERGGVLLADAICASRAFRDSFRREMAAVFPACKLEQIPATDPLWSKAYGGADLRLVSFCDPQAAGAAQPVKTAIRQIPPDLEGIKCGDRWGVVFSQYDLSCALEKQDSLGCRGYTRDDAARIGLNVVLYALQQ